MPTLFMLWRKDQQSHCLSFVLFISKLLNYCQSRCSYQKPGLEEGEKMEQANLTWKDSSQGEKMANEMLGIKMLLERGGLRGYV